MIYSQKAKKNLSKSSEYTYDSLGRLIREEHTGSDSISYTYDAYDKETETIYLRARYYQPNVGRFLTRDTYTGEESDSLSLNLYTYCNNDGVNNVDPSGHIAETVLDVVSFGDSVYCMVTEPSLTNAAFLAWDTFSLIPGVPGSYVAKLTGKAAKAAKATKVVKKVKLTLTKNSIRKVSSKTAAKLAKKIKPKKIPQKLLPKSKKIIKKSVKSTPMKMNLQFFAKKGSSYYKKGKKIVPKGSTRLRKDVRNVNSSEFKEFIRSQGKSFKSNEWKKVMETWKAPSGKTLEIHYWRNKKTGEIWSHR